MPSGIGRNIMVAKVANFSETAKHRRWNGGGRGLVRFNDKFFYKHPSPKGEDVKFIYESLTDGEVKLGQNGEKQTMKNTAARVGPIRGCGGRIAPPTALGASPKG